MFFMLSKGLSVSISLSHCFDQSLSVDEWKESDTHPFIPGTIYVDVEVGWVEIDDLRFGVGKEGAVAKRDCMSRLLWEDTHELLKGSGRITHLKPKWES